MYTSVKAPVPLGVNTPAPVICSPLHVPPAGVPTKVAVIGWLQRVESGPALTTGKGLTVIAEVAEALHPVAVVVPVTV